MKILIAGGGSGGHVNPALSMADSLRNNHPKAKFLFVGSKRGLENDLVPKAGYKLAKIPVMGFSRKGGLSKLWPYLVLVAGMIKAFFIYLKFRPDMAFGTGGFAAGPILFWTSFFKVPTLIHESNVLPGITNRMLSQKADITAVGFPESSKQFNKAKRIEVTGNPIKQKLLNADRSESRKELNLGEKDKLVVIMGGSQGARTINDAVVEMLDNFYKDGDFKMIFAPGRRHYENVKAEIKRPFKNVEISSYIYNSDVIYSAADLIINRAGAITMAEITALGIPSILIPSSYVAENHQESNARALEIKGGCVVYTDDQINGKLLYEKICTILGSEDILSNMRNAAKAAGILDAGKKLEILFEELLKGVE